MSDWVVCAVYITDFFAAYLIVLFAAPSNCLLHWLVAIVYLFAGLFSCLSGCLLAAACLLVHLGQLTEVFL